MYIIEVAHSPHAPCNDLVAHHTLTAMTSKNTTTTTNTMNTMTTTTKILFAKTMM